MTPIDALDCFVGRSTELEELSAALRLARASEPGLVVVEADPGMGKTSLMRQFVARVGDAAVFEASGDESETSLEYGMLEQLVSSVDDDQLHSLPLLASGPASSADPFSVGAELVQVLGRLEERGSAVVLVLDDMQWADKPSARALLFAFRRLRHDNVLVVLTTRPGGLATLGGSWQRLLHIRLRVRFLRLGGLDVAEIKELAQRLGIDGLRGPAAARVREHTDGHPLYVRTLLEELPADALHALRGPLPAPRSLSATLLSRLAAVSDAAQVLVEATAVLGPHCPRRLVVTLAGLTDETDDLAEAVSSGLLVQRATTAGEELTFTHPLLRAAVYAELSPTRRAALHREAAGLLSGPASLTHRVAATAGCDDGLAAELERTAWQEVAADRSALATDHLLMAADLSSDPVAREGRLLAAIHVMIVAGDEVGARASREAVEACAPGPARSYVLGCLAIGAGGLEDAEVHLQAALSDTVDARGLPYRRWALITLSVLDLLRGDPDEAVLRARDALGHVDGDTRAEVFARLYLAMGMASAGQFDEGLAVLHTPSDTPALPVFEANLLCEQGILRLWANDVSGAMEDLSAALRWSRSGRPVRNLSSLHGSLADAQYRAGAWDQAVVNAELSVSLAVDTDMLFDLPMAHAVAAYVHAGRGDFDVANDHAHRSRAAATAIGTPAGALFAGLAEATVAQASGDTGAALRALEACLAAPVRHYIDRMLVVPWRILYAEVLVRSERFEEAEAAITNLEHLAARGGAPATQLHALRLRGMLLGAIGDMAAAAQAFDAARPLELSDLSFASALNELAHGQLLRRTGKRRQAVTRLLDARGRFARMSAEPYVAICDEELVGCGLRRERGDTSPVALTPREEAVARLVASGLSNPEAAADLYVSTKTVEYHLSNAFAKLNISSRRQLAEALEASSGSGT